MARPLLPLSRLFLTFLSASFVEELVNFIFDSSDFTQNLVKIVLLLLEMIFLVLNYLHISGIANNMYSQ